MPRLECGCGCCAKRFRRRGMVIEIAHRSLALARIACTVVWMRPPWQPRPYLAIPRCCKVSRRHVVDEMRPPWEHRPYLAKLVAKVIEPFLRATSFHLQSPSVDTSSSSGLLVNYHSHLARWPLLRFAMVPTQLSGADRCFPTLQVHHHRVVHLTWARRFGSRGIQEGVPGRAFRGPATDSWTPTRSSSPWMA